MTVNILTFTQFWFDFGGDLGLRTWTLDSDLSITELVIHTPACLLNVSFTTPRENIIHEMRLFRKTSNQFSLTPLSIIWSNLRDASSCDTRGGGGMGGSLANSWPDEALCCPSDDIRTLERPLIGQQQPLIGQWQPLIGQIDPIKSIKDLRRISLNGGGLFWVINLNSKSSSFHLFHFSQ